MSCFFCRQASKYLLADFLDLSAKGLAVLHGEVVQKHTFQILLLQFLRIGKLEGDASQNLTDAVSGLKGFDIGCSLILLVLIPVQFPEKRELAGQVADGLQVTVGQGGRCQPP